jgi:hypothetical protein
VPATFFLTTRWLGAAGCYWWDLLECALLGSQDLPASLEIELAQEKMRFPTGSAEERRRAHDAIHAHLVRASLIERDRSIAAVLDWSGSRRPQRRPMQADEVRALAAMAGMEIGAHRQPSGADVSIRDRRPKGNRGQPRGASARHRPAGARLCVPLRCGRSARRRSGPPGVAVGLCVRRARRAAVVRSGAGATARGQGLGCRDVRGPG